MKQDTGKPTATPLQTPIKPILRVTSPYEPQPHSLSQPPRKTVMRVQGSLLDLRLPRPTDDNEKPRFHGACRGVVKMFSASSRRRLLRLASALDVKTVARFVTLTLPEHSTDELMTQAYNRFRERMRRAYPMAAWIWRKEYQQNGTPHLHLIVWRSGYIPGAWLWDTWQACVGERARVDIKLLKSRRAVLRYVSKYVAKRDDTPKPDKRDDLPDTSFIIGSYLHAESIGRQWGLHNRENIPFAQTYEISFQSFDDMVRYLQWTLWRVVMRKSYAPHTSVSAMTDNAQAYLDAMAQHHAAPINPAEIPLWK